MPEVFMIAPARTKSGIAISGNLVAPSNITTAAESRLSGPDFATIATAAITPSATAIGTLISTSANSATSIRSAITRRSPRAPARAARGAPRASARAG